MQGCSVPHRISEKVGEDTRGMVRVIDESGEDYLYPKDSFIAIARPENVKSQVLALAG